MIAPTLLRGCRSAPTLLEVPRRAVAALAPLTLPRMTRTALAPSLEEEVDPHTAGFYRAALQALADAKVPFLVGGAFAHACFTGIRRSTKDLDLFIRREDYDRVCDLMHAKGWRTQMTFPHWLAKVYAGEDFIDLIFNSGNGVTPVDDRWFRHNAVADVLGVPVKLANIEDSLMSKAFIMERERYDGADVAHLIQANAERIDWRALMDRFGMHWRVLLAHLTIFGFVYPGERHRVPNWVMEQLVARLAAETRLPPVEDHRVCNGTLISREQYLYDVESLGYVDGRLTPSSTMTAEDIAVWTDAIPSRQEEPEEADAPPPPAAASVTGWVDLA
jgi:predicted nucleotidyltransferase